MRRHVIFLTLLIGVISALSVTLFLKVRLVPLPASEQGQSIDNDLRLLFALGSIVFIIVLVFVTYSAAVFRRRPGDTSEGAPIVSNRALEVSFILIPLAIVMATASYSSIVLTHVTGASSHQQELQVKVTAFQWGWRFEYPELGIASTQLGLPVGRPVLLRLTSQDVIHSFYVPEFLLKQDAVPGMETQLRFTPRKVGEYTTRQARYRVICAELCGLGHSYMIAPVTVMEEGAFEKWVEEQRRAR